MSWPSSATASSSPSVPCPAATSRKSSLANGWPPILDCPTRGVDIGVKASMYKLINNMKKRGKSIVLISEELPELCGMSDRLIIMKDGAITGEFWRTDGFDSTELIDCMI